MRRVNISVDGSTFNDISSQAQHENKTLFAFTNEWLSVVSKLSNEGWSPSKLHGLCHSISLLKEMDVITLPSDFVDELIARQYKTDKEGLLKMFRDMGNKIASVVKITAPEIGELAQLATEFLALVPLKVLSISTHENGNTAEIDIVGAGRRMESTECTLELLLSIFDSYSYDVWSREVSVGTIRLRATRVSETIVHRATVITK